MLQEQQAAVSANDHGLASFLELLAVVRAPLSLYAHLVKGSRASSGCCGNHFAHSAIIGCPSALVNLAFWTGVLYSKRLEGCVKPVHFRPLRRPSRFSPRLSFS